MLKSKQNLSVGKIFYLSPVVWIIKQGNKKSKVCTINTEQNTDEQSVISLITHLFSLCWHIYIHLDRDLNRVGTAHQLKRIRNGLILLPGTLYKGDAQSNSADRCPFAVHASGISYHNIPEMQDETKMLTLKILPVDTKDATFIYRFLYSW